MEAYLIFCFWLFAATIFLLVKIFFSTLEAPNTPQNHTAPVEMTTIWTMENEQKTAPVSHNVEEMPVPSYSQAVANFPSVEYVNEVDNYKNTNYLPPPSYEESVRMSDIAARELKIFA
ncbi:uncharacterized protein LOC110860835 [Folsomia candida]|uniref:Uncharacterized protein n=1 Tax=Folsomia candida TaxID=158441 RepID=A0A226D7D1_FOLCA|nr:uncharacterized protein LOC110860835 [Folsomia candida]OXA40176.1 hypothetical protein Fcan01_25026 [Folsomia candida]